MSAYFVSLIRTDSQKYGYFQQFQTSLVPNPFAYLRWGRTPKLQLVKNRNKALSEDSPTSFHYGTLFCRRTTKRPSPSIVFPTTCRERTGTWLTTPNLGQNRTQAHAVEEPKRMRRTTKQLMVTTSLNSRPLPRR